MRRNRRRLLVATTVVVATGLLMMAGSAVSEDETTGQAATFLKVGNYHINLDHVDYTMSEPDGIVVVFRGQGKLKLTGIEADAIRKWLDPRSASLPETQRTANGGSKPNPTPKDEPRGGNEGFRNRQKDD